MAQVNMKERNLSVPSPQAVPIPNSRVKGRSAVYRNVIAANDINAHPPSIPKIKTAYEAFEYGYAKKPDQACLGHREYIPELNKWSPYVWETYSEIRLRRDNFGSGLLHLYQDVVKGTKSTFAVGIYSINRKEWVLTDLACQAYSLVSVALYDTLGPNSSEYIINTTEIEVMVASMDLIPKILAIRDKIPCLKAIICMNAPKPSSRDIPGQSKLDILKAWGASKDIAVVDFLTVEALGATKPQPNRVPKPEDIFTINFTSGTTGNPKGVVLTHSNAAVAAMAPSSILNAHTVVEKDEFLLSFLPLAHIFERGNMLGYFLKAAAVGMYHGVILELLDDIQALRPTLLVAVPRLLLRIEMAIRSNTVQAPGIRGALSRKALADKYARMDAGGDQFHPVWDRIWSRKINANLGGRLELIISGSAPLPKETVRFLKAALACEVIEGYGMTETTACGTVAHPGDRVIGHVGPPVPYCEVVLEDVPSMNYTADDKPFPRGELLLRGGMRLKEYYKDPAKTAEAVEKDGWLHTGDVATIDNEGRVYIIDRVKNIFKLSQGEYIAAERLEAMYSSCDLVEQIFVHGDSLQSYIVGVVGVNAAVFAPFASTLLKKEVKPFDAEAIKEACKDSRIRKAVIAELDRIADLRGLAGFEKLKNVVLLIQPFSVENDTLTPSFKLKRPNALKLFRKEVDQLYAETGTQVKALCKL